MRDVIAAPRFTDERLAQLVKQRVASMRSSIVGNGSAYASTLAAAQVSPLEALDERQGGFTPSSSCSAGRPRASGGFSGSAWRASAP